MLFVPFNNDVCRFNKRVSFRVIEDLAPAN